MENDHAFNRLVRRDAAILGAAVLIPFFLFVRFAENGLVYLFVAFALVIGGHLLYRLFTGEWFC